MRYLRLYLHFLRFSFSRAMEFRIDFFFRVVMDIIFYIVQFAFFKIIYLHTPVLGGWNQQEMTLFIATFIFVDAFHMTVFANNTWWFPISINRGDLDYYLTRPVSSFFFLGFKEFAANSMINLILAFVLICYFLVNFTHMYELIKLPLFFILLINGAFLYFMTFLIFLMAIFWTHSPRGFADVFYSAEKVLHRPDGIFKGYFRRFFLHILPFSLMASYPVRYLLESNSNYVLVETLLTSAAIYFLVFLIWKRGLRNYSSASS